MRKKRVPGAGPDARITDVGVDPVIEDAMGAGDPAVKPGTVDEERDGKAPAKRRDFGLLGE